MVEPGDVLLKSNTVAHEDRFSESGARVLSIAADDAEFAQLRPTAALCWRRLRSASALRLALTLVDAAQAGDRQTLRLAAADLLSEGDDTGKRRPAPRWLARLKEELETVGLKNVEMAARAAAAGVHPAHLSRVFRQCFGVSVTAHAQFHSMRRAYVALARGASLSEAALEAGFYDQSHMSRVFRRVIGRTPGACRRLLAPATASAVNRNGVG